MSRDQRPRPRDWGQASRVVADAYFPHELRLIGGSHEPRLTLRTLDLGPVMIGQVGWGADVAIDCAYPGAYEVNLPITGHLESRGRHGTVTSVVGQATVFRADAPSRISHWDATCTVLGVKFDRSWLEVEAERVLGSDRSNVHTVLPDQLRLDHGPGRGWRQLVTSLASNLRDPQIFDSRRVREQLAGAVTAGLLETCCPEDGSRVPAQPTSIRRVLEAVHDDPARPWTSGELAALAGTSARRLQEGFQRWLGCSPSQYLLDIRVQRANADLVEHPELTVADAAARWGFSSPSRLAAAYRRRYGRPPSHARD